LLYVTAGYANKVAIIDTASDAVVSTAPGGSGPGLSVSTDGTRLYEMNLYNLGLTVVDTSSLAILANFYPAGCADPEGVRVSPDGTRLYVPCVSSQTVAVIDTANYGLIANVSLGGRQPAQTLAFTPDSIYAYVAASGTVFVLRSTTGEIATMITVPADSDVVIGGSTPYTAQVLPPINSSGSSVFNASRGVVPIKFTLALSGQATCALPEASLAVFRVIGDTSLTANENDYIMPPDSGVTFRTESCQYIYNLGAKSLGVGRYRLEIRIRGSVVGTASFALK